MTNVTANSDICHIYNQTDRVYNLLLPEQFSWQEIHWAITACFFYYSVVNSATKHQNILPAELNYDIIKLCMQQETVERHNTMSDKRTVLHKNNNRKIEKMKGDTYATKEIECYRVHSPACTKKF